MRTLLFAAVISTAGCGLAEPTKPAEAKPQGEPRSRGEARSQARDTSRPTPPPDKKEPVADVPKKAVAPEPAPAPKPAAPKPAPPKPAPKPPAETPKSLLEKGREQCRKGDFILAEQTWLKGLDLCGEGRDEQLLKGEMYLRVGLVKEHLIRSANGGRLDQSKTIMYYEKFNQILMAIGEPLVGRQLAIQMDQHELETAYFFKK